jgi:hypothetical protein
LIEAALPDVATGVVVPLVTADIGSEHPVHPAAQVAVAQRPERQMEMIGHQAVSQDPHRMPQIRLGQQSDEGLEISWANNKNCYSRPYVVRSSFEVVSAKGVIRP